MALRSCRIEFTPEQTQARLTMAACAAARTAFMAGKIRVRHALPLWQRLRRRWRAWRGAGLNKSHVVHFVQIGEARFKRVGFAAAETAQAVAEGLERLADSACFPALLMRDGHQVWVDYVPGGPPQLSDPADQQRLVEFFVRLYGQAPVQTTDPAPISVLVARDLDFLSRCGVLTQDRSHRLLELERALRPSQVCLGMDYIDPLAKNFVIRGDQAVAIDIEALILDTPLGTGLAKAWLRWPFDPAPEVLRRVLAAGGPDLAPQLAWTRLSFLGSYFKQKVLQGKPTYIRLDAFDRLGQSQTAQTPP